MKRTNQGVLRLNLGLSPLDSQSQIFIYLCLGFLCLSFTALQQTELLSNIYFPKCSFAILDHLIVIFRSFLSGLFIYLFVFYFKYLQSELRGPGDWKEKTDRAGGQTEILHRPCQAVTRSEPVHTRALSPGRREPPMYQQVGHQPLAGSMVGVDKPPYLGGERSGI